MPISDLMMTGLQLMLLGMGIVFGFLIVLVIALKVMSWFAGRFPATEAPAPVAAATQTLAPDTTVIAVISAAVARYRAARGNR